MTSRDFCFWLQGMFELMHPSDLNEHQTDLIQKHLALVFKHEIDPSYSPDPKVQAEMNAIHHGKIPVYHTLDNGNPYFGGDNDEKMRC